MLYSLLFVAGVVLAAPAPQLPSVVPVLAGASTAPAPTVTAQHATVIGASASGVDTFNGIPYAQPPVSALRLRPPVSVSTNLGTVTATGTPTACPQFKQALPTNGLSTAEVGLLLGSALGNAVVASGPEGEDCLTLNVQKPSFANSSSKLPVAVWIYGGGFEFGSTQGNDATDLISNSIAVGMPIVYVQMNYRLSGFGFMPGEEIMSSGNGNIGLLDQRLAIEWVADNIAAFGGDPTKVTIFGESAGSISVFNKMALYGGKYTYKNKPLFRAAIMDSGCVVPADPLNCTKGQVVYDTVVAASGCSGASDTLACLRTVPYATFNAAVQSVPGIFSYSSVALSYLPRPDGTILQASPDVLAQEGKYAPVPFIIGDQQDEGTVFSLTMTNLSTTADVVNYLSTYFFKDASIAQIQGLVNTYPDDPSDGSPYNTGPLYNFYPQFKRIAALLGDLTFTLTRRGFLTTANKVKPTVPNWSYLATYDYGIPLLGTYHSTDVGEIYGSSTSTTPFTQPSNTTQAYYISFFNHMNPNTGVSTPQSLTGTTYWPTWNLSQSLMEFGTLYTSLITDNFRAAQYAYATANQASFHV